MLGAPLFLLATTRCLGFAGIQGGSHLLSFLRHNKVIRDVFFLDRLAHFLNQIIQITSLHLFLYTLFPIPMHLSSLKWKSFIINIRTFQKRDVSGLCQNSSRWQSWLLRLQVLHRPLQERIRFIWHQIRGRLLDFQEFESLVTGVESCWSLRSDLLTQF